MHAQQPPTLVNCFAYVETDIPPGMTIPEYRRARSSAEKGGGVLDRVLRGHLRSRVQEVSAALVLGKEPSREGSQGVGKPPPRDWRRSMEIRKIFRRRVKRHEGGLNVDASINAVVAAKVGESGKQHVGASSRQRATDRPDSTEPPRSKSTNPRGEEQQ